MVNYYFNLLFTSFMILYISSTIESTGRKLKIGDNMPVVVFDSSGHLNKFHGLSFNRNEEGEDPADPENPANPAEDEQLPTTTPNSTMLERCITGESPDCCYEFTWPGFVNDYQKYFSNSSCARYKKDNNFPDMACYDPLVFTNASGRPDLDHLRDHCFLYNCRQIIHCAKASGQTCIKYSYYRDNVLVNQTRFCGSVSDSDSSSQIRSGCYKQNIPSSPLVREVCTCDEIGDDGHPCNWGSSKYIVNLNMFILSLIIAFTFKIC